MGVTMSDIAKAAGASVSTVGRVLHGNGYVSESARERIEKAVRELGYVPNQSARTLKSRHSGLIGSLVLQNPNGLYYRINDSILDAAEKNGFRLVTMEASSGSHTEGQLIQNFIGLGVDGLVITSNMAVPPESFKLLRRNGIPVVAVERGYPEQAVDNLVVEDFAGAYGAVRNMAAKGHKRIGLIAASPLYEVERQRFEGYRRAVGDSGAATDPELAQLVEGYSAGYGRAAAERLFALDEPPTAVFCTADTLAAGALQVLYAKRLRVPEDVSLAGYDDVLSASLSPAIDSVGLELDGIGEKVISLLMDRMEDPELPARQEPIHTRYVDRNTVGEIHNNQGGYSQ